MTEVHAQQFVVDADSHVLEPPDLWNNYLEPQYRDRGIYFRRNSNNLEELIVDQEVLMAGGLAGLGGAEHAADELFLDPHTPYIQGCPKASFDTHARLKMMDEQGVNAGVLFPTVGILWDKPEDPELAIAYARAYNNWLWDFSSPALDRLVPIAHIPLYDVDLAVTELRRCLALGFKGMFLAPEPVMGKRPSHPVFDPVWQELVGADLPVCMHLIVRFNRAVNQASHGWWDSEKEPTNPVFTFGLGGTMQLIPAVSALACDGFFDRFPKLKVLVVESGAGYAGYLMDRLDEKYDRFKAMAPTARRPSDYLRENFWFVMDPSERSISAQCDMLGEEHFLWGSDYPHIDSHVTAADEVRAVLESVEPNRRDKILGGNAKSLFQL